MRTRTISKVVLATFGGVAVAASLSACSVASVDVGACVNSSDMSGEITDIPTVDCSESHDGEAFYKFDLPDGDYPGEDGIESAVQDKCLPEFKNYVGSDYSETDLNINYIGPSEDTWGKAKDREVICFAVSSDPLTKSVKGSKL